MKKVSKQEVVDTLLKKALGYLSEEVVEEFSDNDGEVKLTKRKITKKDVPPDLSAIKMILDEMTERPVAELSDEELAKEKTRLLQLLKEKNGE